MLCDKRKSGIFGWISLDQMNRLCYDMYRNTRIFYFTTIQMELSVQ